MRSREVVHEETHAGGRHGTPIANFKASSMNSSNPTTHVHIGGGCEGSELFEIHAKYQQDGCASMRVEFINKASSKPCTLGFEGYWYQRDALFWLDRDGTGVRMLVAKVYRQDGVVRQKSLERPGVAK